MKTGRNQLSQESEIWGNGAFTKAVVEELNGKAKKNKEGEITIETLNYYTADRVKELTDGGQVTFFDRQPPSIPDFPIAVV
ncbi:MAG: hypothetical protein HQK92_11465 [Nitrospirae bacterium]|nr:hypothetical protein [Nitrospirota bacterium]